MPVEFHGSDLWTLAGHAFLPALTLITPPADAPRDAWVSGKFTGKSRNHNPMSVMGDVGAAYGSHPTGISLPFISQPVQGMSGFAMNRAEAGKVERADSIFLRDPDRKVPFRIA